MVEVEFKFWPPDYCADKPYITPSLKKVSKEGLRGLKYVFGAKLQVWIYWSMAAKRVTGDLERCRNRNSGPEAKQQLCYQNEVSSWLGGWVGKWSGLV